MLKCCGETDVEYCGVVCIMESVGEIANGDVKQAYIVMDSWREWK